MEVAFYLGYYRVELFDDLENLTTNDPCLKRYH